MSSTGSSDSRRAMARGLVAFVTVAACSLTVAQNREPMGSAANVPTNVPGASELPPAASPPPTAGNTKPSERLREGTKLTDVTGTFQSIGNENVSFSPSSSKDSFRVLENLALERISRTLDENRGPRQWIVSGLITEYRGSNYVLVHKAVIQQHDGDAATAR